MILFNFCVYVYLSAYCMYSESVYVISKRKILVHAGNMSSKFKSLSELRVDYGHDLFFALKRLLFPLVIAWKHKTDTCINMKKKIDNTFRTLIFFPA